MNSMMAIRNATFGVRVGVRVGLALCVMLTLATHAATAEPMPGTDGWIATAQKKAAAAPKNSAAYDDLGQAYFQKARETGDAAFYQLAETTLQKALALAADDPNEQAASKPCVHLALVYMGEHRFRDALTYADQSLSGGVASPEAFALMGDAHADLGQYEEAEADYRSLAQMGAFSRSPLQIAYVHDSRLSYLKYIHGDSDAAIALMKSAVWAGLQSRIPAENMAWLYYELGERYFSTGDLKNAELAYASGVQTDPNHFRALAGLAKVRAAQGRMDEAIQLYQRSLNVVPMPAYLAELGDVYRKVGRMKEAQQQYDLVEYIGYLNNINKVLNGRELAEFYADHDSKLGEALTLAREELALRQDVVTWDVLAWVLYKNHKLPEAADAMQHALAYKTKNALFYFHAGMIYRSMGEEAKASQSFADALKFNPAFHVVFAEAAANAVRDLHQKNNSRESVSR